MFTVRLRCPRCGAAVEHGFMRLAVVSNLGSDPCPSCGAPLRYALRVRDFDLATVFVFLGLVVGALVLNEQCAGCRELTGDLPAAAPRTLIAVTCLVVMPLFFAIARRLYFARQLRRGTVDDLLEVFTGDED